MAARPDVGGVVHTHPPYVLALAAAGAPLLPVSHAANYFSPRGVPRFTETADLILTPELGKKVAACLGDASAVFLVNHGMVTVAPTCRPLPSPLSCSSRRPGSSCSRARSTAG
jgi:ribulose-5-phosphate 4-epimerase/fuculose-1-phosphate aldolase